MKPTRERVLELLTYDRFTGVFRWRITRNNFVQADSIAGCLRPKGHRYIEIDGRPCAAHHLAWLVVHGEWPEPMIDHIDRCPDHNWITNLRVASSTINAQSRETRARTNTSGYMGVGRTTANRWKATIYVSGKNQHIGVFATPEEAHAAYLAAKSQFHPGYALETT